MFLPYILVRTPASLVHFGRVASAYFGLKRFPKYTILFFLVQIAAHFAVNVGYVSWPISPKKITEMNIVLEREKKIQDSKFKESIESYKKSHGVR